MRIRQRPVKKPDLIHLAGHRCKRNIRIYGHTGYAIVVGTNDHLAGFIRFEVVIAGTPVGEGAHFHGICPDIEYTGGEFIR